MFTSKKTTPELLDKDEPSLSNNIKSPFYNFAYKGPMIAKMIADTKIAITDQKDNQADNNNIHFDVANSINNKVSKLIQIQAEFCHPVPIYLLTNPAKSIDQIVQQYRCFEDESRDLYIIQRVSIKEAVTVNPVRNNITTKMSPELENLKATSAFKPSTLPSVLSYPALARPTIEWQELNSSKELVNSNNLIFSQKKANISLPTQPNHAQKTKQIYLIQIKFPPNTASENDEQIRRLIEDLVQLRGNNGELLFIPDNLSMLFEKAFIILSNLSLLKRKEMVLFENFVSKDIKYGVKNRFERDLKIYTVTNGSNNHKNISEICIESLPQYGLKRFFKQDVIKSAMQQLRIITLNNYLQNFHHTIHELIPFLTCTEEHFRNNEIQTMLSKNYHDYFWRELNRLRSASSQLTYIDEKKFYTDFFGYPKIDYSKKENQDILAEFLVTITKLHNYTFGAADELHSSKTPLVANGIFIKTLLSYMKDINSFFNEIGFYPAQKSFNATAVINNNNNPPANSNTPNPGATSFTQFGNKITGKRKENPNAGDDNKNDGQNKIIKRENSPSF